MKRGGRIVIRILETRRERNSLESDMREERIVVTGNYKRNIFSGQVRLEFLSTL